jgi:hypothetical protein
MSVGKSTPSSTSIENSSKLAESIGTKNLAEARSLSSSDFFGRVRTSGGWDYKNNIPAGNSVLRDEFGNFHFGAMSAVYLSDRTRGSRCFSG